jgi:hypothetical protein
MGAGTRLSSPPRGVDRGELTIARLADLHAKVKRAQLRVQVGGPDVNSDRWPRPLHRASYLW